MKTCPACGQFIPPAVNYVSVMRGKVPIFCPAPVRQRVYDFISRHPEGVTREQVFDAVYGNDPNGGPDTLGVISVHVRNINKYLEQNGVPLRVRSTMGRGALYRLVKCES